MRSTIKQLLFYTMFLLGTWVNIYSQVFPITVNAKVNNPPAIYLSNYADATTINGPLQLQLLLSDLSITNRQLQLKVYFEGNGFQLESAPVVSGAPPIFIDGGTPLNLGSFELGAYFELRNLTGISPNAYATSIPEGSYQFCFEVFDFITGNRLSAKTCTTTYIFQNEPPFLVLPTEATEIDASLPQNILFQWTPRHINVTNVEYELSIVEVWDYQVDPQTAFLSSPPVYTEKVTNTRLLYGPSKPLLLENKRYAWRVQAIAKQGAEDIGLFKNNGYSEISYFDFRMPCTSPLNISTEVKGIYKTNIYWDKATGDTNSYLVRYREANNPDAEWFTTRTSENWTTLWDLKEATTYEYQISSECVLGSSNFSQSDTFTTQTAEDEDSYYNCGISPDITLSNTEPISELLVGETFKAGDFPVKVTEISGSSGRYTGKGRVNIPYLKNIGVSVKFTNILVNTDKALADGMVVTTYDPTMGNIVDVDEVIDEINNIIDTVEDIGDIIGGGDHIVTEVDFEIDPEKTVVEDDKIIITGTNGEVKEIDRDEEDTYEIVGNEKVYRVDKEGNLTEVGAAAEGGSATAANTTGVSNGPTSNGNGSSVTQLATNDVEITFNSGKGVYGFDTAESDYEKEIYPKTTDAAGNNVYPVHKAVVNNFTDTFEANVTIKNESIKIEDLIFKTLSGKKIETEATGNTIEITVTGADGYRQEEVIVTYPKEDETQVVVGNFFLHHLAMHSPIKLGIVSINGASTSGVSNTIKEIYKTAGVEFQVTDTINFDITGLDWDKDNNQQITYDGSGKFTNYPSELISIFKGFKEAKSDTYYIFVTDIATSNPLGGFMPKGSQFGFVFSNGSGDEAKDSKGATAAHELGHGIFSLRHPFEDSGSKTSGTDWLMDYGTGKELSQVNWAQIGSDALNLNPINIFQNDEDNEQIQNSITTYLSISNNNWQDYAFLSPIGTAIVINNCSHVQFNEDGAIIAFIINNEKFRAVYSTSTQRFIGYISELKDDFIKNYTYITEEFLNEFESNKYNGIEYAPIGENVIAIAKIKYDSTYLDCIFEYTWKNQILSNTYTGIASPPFVPENSTAVYREGDKCIDFDKVKKGTGISIYYAFIDKVSEDQELDLIEFSNFISDKTNKKNFAFYHKDIENENSVNSITALLRYLRENEIYSFDKFKSFGHFPHEIYSRDADIVFTSVDLRDGIPENYNSNSLDYVKFKLDDSYEQLYEYSLSDLQVRYNYIQQFPSDPITRLIFESERLGEAAPISQGDFYDQYTAMWGSDSSFMFIAQWTAEFAQDFLAAYYARQLVAEYGVFLVAEAGKYLTREVIKKLVKDHGKKALQGALIDYGVQVAFNYMFNDNITTYEQAASPSNINWTSVVWSGAENAFEYNKLLTELAISGAGACLVNGLTEAGGFKDNFDYQNCLISLGITYGMKALFKAGSSPYLRQQAIDAFKKGKDKFRNLLITKGKATPSQADEFIESVEKSIDDLGDGADNASNNLFSKYKNLASLSDDIKSIISSKGWSDDVLKKLDDDLVDETSDLFKYLDEKPSSLDTWKYVSDLKTSGTSKLTRDTDFLKVVERQINNGLVNKIGSYKYDDIIKKYAGQCIGCDAPVSGASEAVKHLPPPGEMLSNLEVFINKHYNTPNFNKVIEDLAGEVRKQKGAEFISRILKEQDGVSAFEFKYLDELNNTADFVLNNKIIDGKSWSVTGSINNIGGWNFPKQLKDYINNGNFEQWFDYSRFQKSASATYNAMSKADATKHIKEQYQKLFSKNDYAIFDDLRGSKWFSDNGINNALDFKEAINDVYDDFYNFIQVK